MVSRAGAAMRQTIANRSDPGRPGPGLIYGHPVARLTIAPPTGWRLTYHRLLQWVGSAIAGLAIVATLLPWHEVRDSGFGEGMACAFMVDCHVTPVTRAERLAGPPQKVCTGLQHGGVFLIGLLVLLLAARVVSLRRPRIWLSALVGLHTLAIVLAFLLATLLMHFFDMVSERPGWFLVLSATAALALVGLADLVSVWLVFLRRRRAAAP